MPFAATWMDLESYEVSQTEEEKYHDIPYTWNRERNYEDLFSFYFHSNWLNHDFSRC